MVDIRKVTQIEQKGLLEYALRKNMAVNIFRPLPNQDWVFTNQCKICLVRGGNRSGKSTTCAVRCGAAAMDLPITLSDGKTQVHCRRPHQRGKHLVIWIIGFDWLHIGTIYDLLFKEGLFGRIYDNDLGCYRAWRPEDGEENKKPSPPVIPKRYINPESWAWENKKLRHFRKVEIWNPETKEPLATIMTFPSTADAKAGDIVDIIWIDEKIENADHFDEWKARLTDRRGHLFWSSWPSVENDALRKISEQAEIEASKPNPIYGECILRFSDNKAMPQDVIDDRLAEMTTEEERLARDLGEYITGLTKMYPEFNEFEHDVYAIDDALSRELKKHGGNVPPDWTREIVVDPGYAHPAVLLGAIPPPRLGNFLVVYGEISVTQKSAMDLAKKFVKPKTKGYKFNRMIIDDHAARQHSMSGCKIRDQYVDAFVSAGITLENDRVYFTPGDDNVKGRISEVQRALSRSDGPPRLRIMTKECPELVKQFKRYLKRTIKKEVEEFEPAPRQQIDMVVTCEYWVASHPRYKKPKVLSKPVEDMDDWEFDDAFFNDPRGKSKRPTSSGMIGPQYRVR